MFLNTGYIKPKLVNNYEGVSKVKERKGKKFFFRKQIKQNNKNNKQKIHFTRS